jgi:hypothetical protein
VLTYLTSKKDVFCSVKLSPPVGPRTPRPPRGPRRISPGKPNLWTRPVGMNLRGRHGRHDPWGKRVLVAATRGDPRRANKGHNGGIPGSTHENLAPVGGIGEVLDVADHAGVEDHLARRRDLGEHSVRLRERKLCLVSPKESFRRVESSPVHQQSHLRANECSAMAEQKAIWTGLD